MHLDLTVTRVQAAGPETMAILTEFDATGMDSYTLLLPTNDDGQGNPLLETYDINSTEFLAVADELIQAHIVRGTLDFLFLQEQVNGTDGPGTYTVESLQVGFHTFSSVVLLSMCSTHCSTFVQSDYNLSTSALLHLRKQAETYAHAAHAYAALFSSCVPLCPQVC